MKSLNNAQFAQVTRHEKIDKKSLESPMQKPFCGSSTTAHVTLISNPEMSCRAFEQIPKGNTQSHLSDCDTLSKMALRKRYSGEANTHRNMLARQKTNGAIIHPEFYDFVRFLRHVGPMPAERATLDRIDNADPEYGPGKVRWADKRTQNNNKSDTLIFHSSRTGETFTASRLAKRQEVKATTIRQRRLRGWTDDEIIEGKRKSALSSDAVKSASPEIPMKFLASVHRQLSAKEIAFSREAARFQYHRENYNGEEAVIAPFEDMIALEGLEDLSPEQYERRWLHFWPDYKPHVIFDNIAASQQQLVAKTDPEYYARWEKQKSLKSTLAKTL